MPTTNTNFSTLITAIDTKAQQLASSTTDPKDLVFLGKAVEALNVADTVSDIIAEGDEQVAAVNTAGTTQVSNVQTEGATQVAAVQAAGAGYATQGNVDDLIPEIAVTVANSKFVIDGTAQESIKLTPNVKYRFDVSDASNSGHPLKFSTTADGTHASPAGTEYTTGVTTSGTAGTADAYVEITVEQDTPNLYYYCANHSGMGGTAYSAYDVLSTAPTEGQVLTWSPTAAAYINSDATGGAASDGSIKPTTLYDEDNVGTWESGWDEHPTYSRVHQYSPKGQFAIHSHTFNSSAGGGLNHNRLRIAPFTVHQTTGQMTFGTRANAFLNTSGYVHSTQSYGFHGQYGVNWGYSAWGSGNTHYHGGAVWKIDNNAVVGGQSTGNSNYANDNTSNGMLAVYEHNNQIFYNIPNGSYTSIGQISTSGTNSDWANASEFNHSSSTYIYRCVGNTVGENHAGLVSRDSGIIAMNATGSNGVTGTEFADGGGQSQAGGIGFELDSGAQVYFTNKGTYIRGTRTGGITAKATVSLYGGATAGIPTIVTSGSDLNLIGFTLSNFTYNTSGYPAKEDDTFYFYGGSNPNRFFKFKIYMPTSTTIELELKGIVDMSEIGLTTNLGAYSGFVDVTGDQDQFLVCSFRTGSYKPSRTIVVDNPIKDA